MLFPSHPKPLLKGRPVPAYVLTQAGRGAVDPNLIILETTSHESLAGALVGTDPSATRKRVAKRA